ncbi:bifunctional phosphoribosylaminoimidazolecarboxamide formyltransferase/IMP cyclohydrolase [Legionella spiritensis]|uniref:Bifunctional purine biosynthesis protein PurH n=1 Tax=Legionella spiritensis TaxID=452 RepID=A0A0W0Z9X2_LEGSP|nr:bifunctional phosphoribosylaminoimidazolecarboxamide formyltransferase/IMP cyclohydrolase [Legionella spiritensis]KTD65917.1 bifunctional phosphoribosylaminoimidazolecarboxamide formyltransferase/IMP cyclohydrolase [Legionella spiritensis]SNV31847.1 phosphoribosylaminoimidazolecarboxamide formyltransferase [Legionella spiritensis]
MMTDLPEIAFSPRRALLSVSDKRGIVELGQVLTDLGVEIIATGNTAVVLRDNGLTVTEVSDCTGFPEMMDGRVKTLHPAIHGGLLARGKQDKKALAEQGIRPIDLLVVNLYPFQQTISHPDCDFDKAIANIDIGGPAMVRAAAKNHAHVTVVVSPNDYDNLTTHLKKQSMPASWPFEMAKKAFAHTAAYDTAITNYLGTLNDEKIPSGFPDTFGCQFHKGYDLRYGENPHQQAVFYVEKNPATDSLANTRLLQGKQLSYNNLLDADAALDCVKSFALDKPACVIVKHGNPCGIAVSDTPVQAYLRAYQTDPASSFGGILAFNQTVDDDLATTIIEKQFAEVIIAPAFSEAAKTAFAAKPNLRILQTGPLNRETEFELNMRHVSGGLLVQEHDRFPANIEEFQVVTEQQPDDRQFRDLLFAWAAVKHVKSNAIVFAKNQATIGIGAGQTSRVMSTRIGLWQAEQAGFKTEGAVMASDAFFPFADSIELAVKAGITAIIQPGGSLRDQLVIDAANTAGLAMVFTGIRHFRH